jgi:hypothetical protein
MKVSPVRLSVVFPSRGRPESLAEAVASLLDHAEKPDQVEVLVACDPDDPCTMSASLPGQSVIVPMPERFGYYRLHEYVNRLARIAAGDWLHWWNDDMRMTTDGWDTEVLEHRPAVLWPYANHVGHANICPAWPRAWSDAMGHVSPTMHLDTYLQNVAEALGRHDRTGVHIIHERSDVTGDAKHDDATYREGRWTLGPEGMVPEPFPYDQQAADIELLRGML